METGGNTSPAPDAGGFDIDSLLDATSDKSEPGGGASSGQPSQGAKGFVFGGRSYPSQKEAEAAHGKLYGRYSEQQGHINSLREAMKNPALAAELAKDPKMREILGKLGVQMAEEETSEVEDAGGTDEVSAAMEERMHAMDVRDEQFGLKMEFWDFEQGLGRKLSKEEREPVLKVISRSPSLSVEEAYYLVNREKLMKDAVDKATAQRKQKVDRPNPIPSAIPGGTPPKGKSVAQMTPEEFRADLREHFREHNS